MESWRLVLTEGFFPQWSRQTLERALKALEEDNPKLTQGSTTTPPPLQCVQDWPCEACDLIAFCSVDDPFGSTVGEVEEGFAQSAFTADQLLGEPAACRWWLNHFDDSPRIRVFTETAAAIRKELERRGVIVLPTDLSAALRRHPDDTVLKRACCDYLLENGAHPIDAQTQSGWTLEVSR